jgi:AcrR family transcriptional regulator
MAKKAQPRRRAGKADVPRHIVATALELAAVQGWRDTTLGDIAVAAKLPLADIHAVYPSKAAILAAFSREIDAEVLSGEDPELADQPPRDRLFDVVMRRFDALAPHKEAVRSIVRGTACDPAAALCGACTLATSMAWMLEVAAIGTSGFSGLARIKGLVVVYLATLRVWLGDDSDDMAPTMAALDKRLRQAERLILLCRLPRPRRREVDEAPA